MAKLCLFAEKLRCDSETTQDMSHN